MMTEAIKPCPFCGEIPYLEKVPLWDFHGNSTHGYYGCFDYEIKCHNPKCRCSVHLGNNCTVYTPDEEAKKNAIEAWNRRFEEPSAEKFIDEFLRKVGKYE